MKLYLDDLRRCPEGWTLARNIREAQHLASHNDIEEMSLDHDLGMYYCRSCAFSNDDEPCFSDLNVKVCDCDCHVLEPTGMDFLKWMNETGYWPTKRPQVHSANIIGSRNMEEYIDDFGPYNQK